MKFFNLNFESLDDELKNNNNKNAKRKAKMRRFSTLINFDDFEKIKKLSKIKKTSINKILVCMLDFYFNECDSKEELKTTKTHLTSKKKNFICWLKIINFKKVFRLAYKKKTSKNQIFIEAINFSFQNEKKFEKYFLTKQIKKS